LKSFEIGNSGRKLAVLIGTAESYIFKEVKEITKYTIILAALALSISGVIVYMNMDIPAREVSRFKAA